MRLDAHNRQFTEEEVIAHVTAAEAQVAEGVIIDPNILVRAITNPAGTVRPILDHLRGRDFVLVYSQPLLDEVAEVLTRPRIVEKYLIGPSGLAEIMTLLVELGGLWPERVKG